MNLKSKIKGSIMGLVLTVAMLVTLMSSFLVLRSGMDAQTFHLYENNDRLLNNANSGIQWLLSPGNPVPLNHSLVVDLFDEGRDSVYLERKAWGIFEIIISKSIIGEKSLVKKALIGTRSEKDSIPLTLYVADMEKPIAVCGRTKLCGKCYVPAAGFKRAYIEGQNYMGDKYIYGAQFKSDREIPKLNRELTEAIQTQLKNSSLPQDSLVNIASLQNDSLVQSFDQKTIVLHSSGTLRLSGIFLQGNIKITAPKVIVSSSCQISQALIIADEIIVEDQATLQVQAFARSRITLGKEVKLSYPSALVVLVDQQKNKTQEAEEQQPEIYVGEKSEITGDLIAWKEKKYLEREAWLSFDKETTINGNVYVNGMLDIKGKIYGSTYCNKFFLKTNSGIYENHLLNAELDASKLPPYYTGASILHQGTRREVLEWL